jgi:hypothetical protein
VGESWELGYGSEWVGWYGGGVGGQVQMVGVECGWETGGLIIDDG